MRLYYYKNEKKVDQPKGVINFDHVSCSVTFKEGKENRFYIHMKGVQRIFKLRAPTVSEFNMWTFKLMKSMDASKGRKFELGVDEKQLSLPSWRFDQVDEKKFTKIADIGDILLFRGKNIGAKITRTFTVSKFGKH